MADNRRQPGLILLLRRESRHRLQWRSQILRWPYRRGVHRHESSVDPQLRLSWLWRDIDGYGRITGSTCPKPQ